MSRCGSVVSRASIGRGEGGMGMGIEKHEFIIFAMDHYNPLGLARSVGEGVRQPIVIAERSKTDISSHSKYVKEYIRVGTVEEGYDILMSRFGGSADRPPFLLTCDDRTIGFLDGRYDEWKDRFIGFNAGGNNVISKYMDKFEVLELAKRHGLRTLDTVCVDRGIVPAGISYPVITKSISPVFGGWKSDVHICRNEDELWAAYGKILADRVIVQKYIDKKNEYCVDGFCADHGGITFNAIESTYNYLIPGYYSPYMTVSGFSNPQIGAALASIMREVGFEGIYSAEFLIDQDGSYYFSEINFRNSTWSYAATMVGMNLPALWAEAMLAGKLRRGARKTFPPFTAMVEPIDYGKRVKAGKVGVGEWLRDFKEAGCTFYYSKEDVEPFLHMCRDWEKFS